MHVFSAGYLSSAGKESPTKEEIAYYYQNILMNCF